ncbi:hypothetical protein KAX08_08130 [candidate division WOR-3 bacterium]|nr:hypothetical protein [candidate division WOR-3 bacterium]
MNGKRFILASIVVFVVYEITNWIVHSLILSGVYQRLQSLWRPDMMDKMWIMYVTAFIFSFLFVYIFTKGYEGKGVAEGFRYGLYIGLLMNIAGIFNQYAIYPVPLSLTIQWFIYGMIQFIIIGIVTALIYRPKAV